MDNLRRRCYLSIRTTETGNFRLQVAGRAAVGWNESFGQEHSLHNYELLFDIIALATPLAPNMSLSTLITPSSSARSNTNGRF